MPILAIDGEMTVFTAAERKLQLLAFLAGGEQLELNLAKVGEIDAAGLQLLVLAKREAAKAGKSLSFVMHSKAVLDVLELCRLAAVFGDQVVLAHGEE